MRCCVCYTKKYITFTSCKHCMCINCLMQLKKTTCPLCRKELYNELPKDLQKYLDIKNNKHPEKRPFYIRLADLNEFPSLPLH